MRIRIEARVRRDSVADGDHRAPLREARAELEIFSQALGEPIKAFGNLFTRREREIVRALVDLDAGENAFFRQRVGERHAIGALLPDRLVEQDDAREELLDAGRREQKPAISAPRLLGAFDTNRLEAGL